MELPPQDGNTNFAYGDGRVGSPVIDNFLKSLMGGGDETLTANPLEGAGILPSVNIGTGAPTAQTGASLYPQQQDNDPGVMDLTGEALAMSGVGPGPVKPPAPIQAGPNDGGNTSGLPIPTSPYDPDTNGTNQPIPTVADPLASIPVEEANPQGPGISEAIMSLLNPTPQQDDGSNPLASLAPPSVAAPASENSPEGLISIIQQALQGGVDPSTNKVLFDLADMFPELMNRINSTESSNMPDSVRRGL